ncbi:hypothetical protein [Nocardioides dongkuii]|uniref:hypothetical protein n=1 Tax=Nocardioides dongkuii TaxID=2760089 RepID=UPI0018776FA7|nr:hypothetical protein [Nocardioides dongkuii]
MADQLLVWLVGVPFALGTATALAPEDVPALFTFADPAIVESSGLVARDDLVVTTNDSGDSGRVFTVDAATGRTVGVTRWEGEPTDVEALAPAGPGEVWVGDIGDNPGSRDSVEVLRVPVGRGDRTVDPERFELVYPDGPTDAETLLAEPETGRLVVVSKEIFGGTVYRAPARLDPDGPNRLTAVGPAPGIATDGAFFPDGRHVVVRDYGSATVLTWPALDTVHSFGLPDQDQGEGIAVDEDGRVLISTEGAASDVLAVTLPPKVRDAVAPPEPAEPTEPAVPSAPPAPDPADETEQTPEDRPVWPWFLGGWLGVGVLVVLLRWLWRRPS